MKVYEGNLVSKEIKVGIVCARFNEFIVSKLLGGALDGLRRHDVKDENIEVAWCPGAFEIPLVAREWQKAASTMRSSAWEPLSAEPLLITTMSAPKYQRVSPPFLWPRIFLSCSAF